LIKYPGALEHVLEGFDIFVEFALDVGWGQRGTSLYAFISENPYGVNVDPVVIV